MVRSSLALTELSRLEFVWTAANYAQVATDPTYRSLLWTSIKLALVYLFLFFPSIIVVVFSFDQSRFLSLPMKGFTTA